VAPDLMSSFAVTLTDPRPALDFEKLTSILFVFAAAQRLDEDRWFHAGFFLACCAMPVGGVFVSAFFFSHLSNGGAMVYA
jgi:hypothetical protein